MLIYFHCQAFCITSPVAPVISIYSSTSIFSCCTSAESVRVLLIQRSRACDLVATTLSVYSTSYKRGATSACVAVIRPGGICHGFRVAGRKALRSHFACSLKRRFDYVARVIFGVFVFDYRVRFHVRIDDRCNRVC